MKKKIFKLSTFVIASSFLFFACSQDDQQSEVENTQEVTEVIEDDFEEVSYSLPSPLQVANLFKNAGLSYIGDITNPVSNTSKYNSKYDQKLNFGIYSADMAYCIINNQTQESINYMKSLRELSEKLWMMDVFNTVGISERLEANVGNEDSLVYIMADLQMQLDEYLEENEMGATGVAIFAGAWLETMYLGVEVINSKENLKLNYKLSEQSMVLEMILNALKQADKDGDYTAFLTDLEKINTHFDKLRVESEEELVLSPEEITNLGKDIILIRNKIINA